MGKLRDELSLTQFVKTLNKDITSQLTLDKNGRDVYKMSTVGQAVEIGVGSIPMLEAGFYELGILADSANPVTFSSAITDKISGVFDNTDNYRNDILFLWNDAIDSQNTDVLSRLREIVIKNVGEYVAPSVPEISSATVEDANPSNLVVLFNINVTGDLTDWSIASDGDAIGIVSLTSGAGTNTYTILLNRSVVGTETLTLSIGLGNTITAVVGGLSLDPVPSLLVTNNVQDASGDVDALAYISAIESESVLISGAVKTAISDFVTALKVDPDIWAKTNAMWLFIHGAYNGDKYNLKDARNLDVAFRLTEFNAPSHTVANGVKGNGVDQYLTTHYAESIDGNGSTSGFIVNTNETNYPDGTFIGAASGMTERTSILINSDDIIYRAYNIDNQAKIINGTALSGTYFANRTNDLRIRRDTTQIAFKTILAGTPPTNPHYIGALNTSALTPTAFSSTAMRLCAITEGLTATQCDAVSVAIDDLLLAVDTQ